MILNDDECRTVYNDAMELPGRSAVSVTRAVEAAVIRKLAAGVSVEPVASDNPDFMTIPVEYQYAYPDGTWRCSNGDRDAMNALQNASNACEAAIAALEGVVNRV